MGFEPTDPFRLTLAKCYNRPLCHASITIHNYIVNMMDVHSCSFFTHLTPLGDKTLTKVSRACSNEVISTGKSPSSFLFFSFTTVLTPATSGSRTMSGSPHSKKRNVIMRPRCLSVTQHLVRFTHVIISPGCIRLRDDVRIISARHCFTTNKANRRPVVAIKNVNDTVFVRDCFD